MTLRILDFEAFRQSVFFQVGFDLVLFVVLCCLVLAVRLLVLLTSLLPSHGDWSPIVCR